MATLIAVCFSFAHEDEELMHEVRRQLVVLERADRIVKWHDRKIPPGAEWCTETDMRLIDSDIVLLLISPHFIESHYCYDVEVSAALRRHDAGEACVIPVILRPCLWKEAPFAKLQALPRDGKAITKWPNRDEACLDEARGVLVAIEELEHKAT